MHVLCHTFTHIKNVLDVLPALNLLLSLKNQVAVNLIKGTITLIIIFQININQLKNIYKYLIMP